MEKVWRHSEWFYDPPTRSWRLTKAGSYDLGEMPEIQLEIGDHQIQGLIAALDVEGWIKPRLDERLRTEDLKITHRLLDIIEGRKRDG